MSYIICFVIPLVYFTCANGVSVLLFKKSFGKCIPMTLMSTSIIVFFSQVFFKTFIVGYVVNILLVVLFLFLLIRNKNNLFEFKKNFFSNGFYTFIIFYICIFFFDLNRKFTKWDEYSHWGVMVKEMFRLDKFYSSKLSTLMVHKDYPPIIPIFELFYSKLTWSFKEENLIKALHLFNACLIIPFIDNNSNKKREIVKSFICLICLFLLILLFDQHGVINTIYIDYTVSLLTAYLLSFVFIEKNLLERFNIINLLIGLSFLILSKQIGLPFCLMIEFLYIIRLLISKKYKNKSIIVVAVITFVPLIFFIGWSRYISTLKVEKQFVISDVVDKRVEKWQKEASTNYINAVKNESMLTSYLKVNYITCLILVLILLHFVCRKEYSRKEKNLLGIVYALGFIGYFFVMLALYTTSFGSDEGVHLASFNRYMPSFVMLCVSSLYMIFISNYSLKKILVLLFVLIIVQNPLELRKLIPKVKKTPQHIFEIQANKLKNNTKKNTKVFLIAQDTVGEYQFGVKFYLDTQTTNLEYFNFPTRNIDDYERYYEKNIKSYISSFDYLYLSKIDSEFSKKYDFLFNEEIKENNLYKIENDKFIIIKGE